MLEITPNMWENADYSLPTENRFIADKVRDMTRDGYQMAGKRRRTNTGSGSGTDSEQRSIFMLSGVEDKLSIIFDELMCIRSNQEKSYRGMLSFQSCFKNVGEKVTEVVKTTNRNTDMLKTLAYKSIDIEARSRRNNLIFWGFVENYSENCFDLIRQFIKNELNLDADRMYLTRAHRLGPVRLGTALRKRAIIVNFRDFCDTEAIMSNAHLLKGTPYSVDRDLPKEINVARKRLWSEVKFIKERNPRAKCQIIYPAKLLVDGKLVRNEFPDWSEALKGDRMGDFSHINEPRFHFDIHEPLPCVYSVQDESDTEETFSVDTASLVGVPAKPNSNGTSNIVQKESIVDMDFAESHTVTHNSTLKNLPSESDKETITNPVNHSRPQNQLFRPFNPEISALDTDTVTPTSGIPVRESRPMQRGFRRAQSKSASKDNSGRKCGTSTGNGVNSKAKNSQPTCENNLTRDSSLKDTGQSAKNNESMDLPNQNSSNSTGESC